MALINKIVNNLRDSNLLRDGPDQLDEEEVFPLTKEVLERWALYVRDEFICPTSSASIEAESSPMYAKEKQAFISAYQLKCTIAFRSCKATPKLFGNILDLTSSHLKDKADFIFNHTDPILAELKTLGIAMLLTRSDFIYSLTMTTLCWPDWTKEEFTHFYRAICNELYVSRYLNVEDSMMHNILNNIEKATNRQSTLNGTLPLVGITDNLTWFGTADNEINTVLNYELVEKTNIAKKSSNNKQRSIHEIKYESPRVLTQRTDKQKTKLRNALELIECRSDLWPYFIECSQYINVDVFSIFDYGAMTDRSEHADILYSKLYEYVKKHPKPDNKISFILMLFPFFPAQHIGLIINKRIKTKTVWQYDSRASVELFNEINDPQDTTSKRLFNQIRMFSARKPILNR
jgi:hypothetical protein